MHYDLPGRKCQSERRPSSMHVVVEWIGSFLGLLGAFLLATNSRVSRWGWGAFFVSNLLLVVLAVGISRWGLLTMQVGFLGTSILGIWRSFRRTTGSVALSEAAVNAWLAERNLVATPADGRAITADEGLDRA
jgi:hypothetical protein